MELTITIDLDNEIFERDEEELQRLLTSVGERYPYPFEPITMEIHAANEQHVGKAIIGDNADSALLSAVKACLPDLRHYASTHGPGPDRRLDDLQAAVDLASA